ncbi:hypothetical protein OVN18_05555 [Microcella daejeonensis]|uniref:DUF3800 domain-containing protein n=1 Tax=Microcella daejeonensis TaxID=2994971 RepID=A0A9E8MMZ0_9MICO|nr:hypothetical protein [Microcella daejeonensis]WAB82466.1 hypothetical protein OVN18_05555 [Microcella daejeonensis]
MAEIEAASFPRDARVFVDESKARGYILAAAVVSPGSLKAAQSELRRLLRPGQSRLHFTSESDSSRRRLLAAMCDLKVRVTVYRVRGLREKEARRLCLFAVTELMVLQRASELVLESADVGVNAADRATISRRLSDLGERRAFAFRHERPKDEPLLWVADAVAWCSQAGGDWMRRCAPLVQQRIDLAP